MDRYERRRRRRRRGQLRLAALVAAVVVIIVVVVLLARGCGGDGNAGDAAADRTPATPAARASASPQPAAKPKPVSTRPPLVSLGDTVRFETPDGAVVRVTASDFTDPADVDGVQPDPGQRLVALRLTVVPEGKAGTALVPLPFTVADSFVLVLQDDELSGATLADESVLGAKLAPDERLTTTLAFSVGASPPVRFVCRPEAGSTPVSATWTLD